MSTLNVRCCCDPGTIFGTLTVAVDAHRPGFFPRALSGTGRGYLVGEIEGETHWIEFREIWLPGGRRERAVYSDDRPIEFWRQVPGFTEGARV